MVSFWAGVGVVVLGIFEISSRLGDGIYNEHKNTNRLSLTVKTNRRVQCENNSKFKGPK